MKCQKSTAAGFQTKSSDCAYKHYTKAWGILPTWNKSYWSDKVSSIDRSDKVASTDR